MHILSIEDDVETQANLCDILELDAYHVDTAHTLREALDRHTWSEYTAIILDRRLPDGTAEQLLPQLKNLAPQAAIIILTGHADLDSTIAAIRHGAADYIVKPINPDALRLSLSRVTKLQEAEQRALQAERLAAIGQMAAAITHESRNALQRIQANVELLRSGFDEMPSEAFDILDRIEQASDEIGGRFDEIRDFVAPLILERELCDLSAVWRRAWRSLSSVWEVRGGEFYEETNQTHLEYPLDSFRFEQVFRNLFENSLAASPDSAQIEVLCCEMEGAGGNALQITIRDYGVGISEEVRPKVFDAFYTTKARGMGLGMAIVKRIVEAHGGKIEVGNSFRQGAEFVITLPRNGPSSSSERDQSEGAEEWSNPPIATECCL